MSKRIYKCKDNSIQGERFYFHCPGCDHGHSVVTPQWSWNGSYEAPTFNPSVLTYDVPDNTNRCHSFVENGKIRFLNDCDHNLRGQTVDLPDLDFMDAT